ncbi:MAG: phosphoribosylamine--glycine ligase [Bacteroidales bacterium]|nr:phosphoribosylamine--glycine ligase [Bacteroidales bacterium]
MNALVIGSGGREHALAWKISQSQLLGTLYCLPGNPGTAEIATNLPGSADDFEVVASAVSQNGIDLVVVGPEKPLVDGLRDFLEKRFPSLMIVGPNASGARLEGSKDFAKRFMSKYSIPTAEFKTFDASSVKESHSFLETLKPPYVLKADGLAGGKGVIIENDLQTAKDCITEMFSGKFGKASEKVVIEQFLSGIEVSVFVLTDGESYVILPEAKDYKRIGVGDTGLNTGGMGAVSPVPFADELFMNRVEERIVKPTIAGLKAEGIDYKGFIFLGLMNCAGDPYVIEYNVRMGDPETEAVMTRIDSDFLSHLRAAATGTLADEKVAFSPLSAVTVVITSGGYPEKYKSFYPIYGLDSVKNVTVFHSGTKNSAEGVVTSGGRVLAVTANAPTVVKAKELAFNAVKEIDFKDCYYRSDIADDIVNYQK